MKRTFGWFNWYRRLSQDYEALTASSEAMIRVSMISRGKPNELLQDWEKSHFKHALSSPKAASWAIPQ